MEKVDIVVEHINKRFLELSKILDNNPQTIVVIAGDKTKSGQSQGDLSSNNPLERYGAYGHKLGTGIAKGNGSGWSDAEWKRIVKTIDENVSKLIKNYNSRVNIGNVGFGKDAPYKVSQTPSKDCIHVWGANDGNWNLDKGKKVEGGGQASAMSKSPKGQQIGMFGIVTMPTSDRSCLMADDKVHGDLIKSNNQEPLPAVKYQDNIFTQKIKEAQEGKKPEGSIFVNSNSVAFFSNRQETTIHPLIVPTGKYPDFLTFITCSKSKEVCGYFKSFESPEFIDKGYKSLVLNGGVRGGQGVNHMHFHLVNDQGRIAKGICDKEVVGYKFNINEGDDINQYQVTNSPGLSQFFLVPKKADGTAYKSFTNFIKKSSDQKIYNFFKAVGEVLRNNNLNFKTGYRLAMDNFSNAVEGKVFGINIIGGDNLEANENFNVKPLQDFAQQNFQQAVRPNLKKKKKKDFWELLKNERFSGEEITEEKVAQIKAFFDNEPIEEDKKCNFIKQFEKGVSANLSNPNPSDGSCYSGLGVEVEIVDKDGNPVKNSQGKSLSTEEIYKLSSEDFNNIKSQIYGLKVVKIADPENIGRFKGSANKLSKGMIIDKVGNKGNTDFISIANLFTSKNTIDAAMQEIMPLFHEKRTCYFKSGDNQYSCDVNNNKSSTFAIDSKGDFCSLDEMIKEKPEEAIKVFNKTIEISQRDPSKAPNPLWGGGLSGNNRGVPTFPG